MVDKRTMHEPSIRVPLVVRVPKVLKSQVPQKIDQQVLTLDFAPSILDICGIEPLPKTHGRSWKGLITGESSDWRDAWYYEYNYEKQFPYTPNVRGIRTREHKYIRYPHGDGSDDRHQAELYAIADDPDETKNLINDPRYRATVANLKEQLEKLIAAADAVPDKMPLDEGIKTQLPDLKIR
jgi:N-acetylglucosamine-6-sulfatase